MTDETITVTSTATPAPAPASPAADDQRQRLHDPSTIAPGSNQRGALEWNAQQKAAHAEMQQLRETMFLPDGSLNQVAKQKWNSLREFVYSNGPVPKHMLPVQPERENTLPDPSGFKPEELESIYAPATRPEEYGLSKGAKLPDRILDAGPEAASETLTMLQQLGMDLQLPPEMGKAILGRILHHSALAAEDGSGGYTTFITPGSDREADLTARAEELLQPIGGLKAAWDVADAYLQSLGSDVYEDVKSLMMRPDGRRSSVTFDPVIIYKLVSLAKARGIVK
jgi:hypothetical protein